MVKKPPRNLEYICLMCGSQGLAQFSDEHENQNVPGNFSISCPKCGGLALFVEREVTPRVFLPVALEKH